MTLSQPDHPTSAPLEPDAIFNSDGTNTAPPPERAYYWHVFGSPLDGKRAGKKNYATVTAGPVPKPADQEVRDTTIPGENGAFFRYIGSFDREPNDADIHALRPKEYR